MRLRNAHLPAVLSCALAAVPAELDAQGRSLFRPTPRQELRDLRTDRPDMTESPYTVDPGHLQIETDLLVYRRDTERHGRGGTRESEVAVLPTNVKIGLLPALDIQFLFDGFARRRSTDLATRTSDTGSFFGDEFTTRVKLNVWGNDGGPSALGVMPYLTLADRTSGGVLVPFALALSARWSVGAMVLGEIAVDEDGAGHHEVWGGSATVGRDLGGGFGGFIELFATEAGATGPGTIVSANSGVTRLLGQNLQLDAGINLGLTRAADGLTLFAGFSWRR